MKISNRFTIAIHMLSMMALSGDTLLTSEWMAGSVNTNPVIVRKISGMLKKAGLIDVRAGTGGATLLKDINDIRLLDVYHAVGVVEELKLFNIHTSPNPQCPIGANIQTALSDTLSDAQKAMEKVLADTTVNDVVTRLQTEIMSKMPLQSLPET